MSFLNKRESVLPLFLLCWCAVQPVLDVISYWTQNVSFGSAVTLTLRLLIFAAAVVLGFLVSRRRRAYWILGICAVLFYVGHLLAWFLAGEPFGFGLLFSDLVNYVRVLQIPFFVLAFASLLSYCKEKGERAVWRGLLIALFIIIAVVLLSVLTGTNPYTYSDKELGLAGWFYVGNGQSAVLAMLPPLTLCGALKSGKRWLFALVCVLGFGELYLYATRLDYISIFIIAAGLLFSWAVCRRLDRFRAVLLAGCALVCALGFSVSPMARNQQLVAENAVAKQAEINELVEQGIEEYGTEGCEYLRYAYEEYLGGLVDKFGLERVAEQYGYSTDVGTVANARLKKLNYCRLMLEEQPVTSLLFGMNLPSMTYAGITYDVENDFHGLFYLYGAVGLAAFGLFLLYFLLLIIRALVQNAKKYFTAEAAACGVALCTGLLHAAFTSGVLRRPNASFYLSLVLAAIWYLVKEKQYGLAKEGKPCS
ncbi:MAG: O-antigen ligase family protein [Oscillospiraceae bacterium]|nr:O-antigen ligase family protein [Oscillospiraceae bacterium]